MAKYEISDQVRDNIFIFLDRVELKGNEAEPLVQIKYILLNPIQEEKSESK